MVVSQWINKLFEKKEKNFGIKAVYFNIVLRAIFWTVAKIFIYLLTISAKWMLITFLIILLKKINLKFRYRLLYNVSRSQQPQTLIK